MPTRADEIIDRRRLRRKLSFWRVVSVALVAIAVILVAAWYARQPNGWLAPDQIARVHIDGTITEDQALLDELKQVGDDNAVKGVILAIDSPGGTTAGGEAIFDAVRRIAVKKPVVAQITTLGASAAYMISTAADHIIAQKTSIVGSIGVLLEYPDVSGLMDKLGIKLESIKSSPLKAEPSPFEPTTDAARAMVRKMILDSYDWFVGLVAERRPLTRDQVLTLADGSIFTGRQAVAEQADRRGRRRAGGEEVAGLQGRRPRICRSSTGMRAGQGGWFLSSSVGKGVARLLGISDGGLGVLHEIGADRIFLDGLLSVWQPEPARSTN